MKNVHTVLKIIALRSVTTCGFVGRCQRFEEIAVSFFRVEGVIDWTVCCDGLVCVPQNVWRVYKLFVIVVILLFLFIHLFIHIACFQMFFWFVCSLISRVIYYVLYHRLNSTFCRNLLSLHEVSLVLWCGWR
jgi:hypothetical protein